MNVALFFTYLGDVLTLGALTAVVILWLWKKQKTKDAIWFGATMAVAGIAIYVLKLIFARQRPEFGFVAETSYSFPSGHALATTVFFLGLWYLLAAMWPQKNKIIGAWSIILIILISWSRLALGVHWTSDVLAGWLFGIIITYSSIFLHKKIILKDKFQVPSSKFQ